MIARSLKRKSKSRLTVVLISTRYRSVDDASDLIAPTVQRFPTEKADWPGNRVVGVSAGKMNSERLLLWTLRPEWLLGLLFDIVKNGRKRNVAGEVLANGS